MTFQEISVQAAQSFLRNIVIVDDQPGYTGTAVKDTEIREKEAHGDTSNDEFAFEGEPGDRESVGSNSQEVKPKRRIDDTSSNKHSLNAALLSRGFAKIGLVCGILKPDETEQEWREDAIRLAESADILVLDWDIRDDNGKAAIEIATKLYDKDKDYGSRLRLIVIYTARGDLDQIHNLVKDSFAERPLASEIKNLSLTERGYKLIFLCKGMHLDDDYKHLGCLEGDLPKRLVHEFSSFSGGLLSNVALATIGELRKHTYEMLGTFTSNMDGPYLSHRTLLKTSSEAEEYALDIIFAEMDAKLPKRQILKNYLGKDAVMACLTYHGNNGTKLCLTKEPGKADLIELSPESAFKVVEMGESGFNDLLGEDAKTTRPDFHTYLHPLLTGNTEIGEQNHLEFSRLTTLQQEWTGKEPNKNFRFPTLKLGSIVKIDKNLTGEHKLTDGYYLCMQPLCDSTRIGSDGAPFVLVKLGDKSKNFDFIIKDTDSEGRIVTCKLKLTQKHPVILTPKFKPKADQDFIESTWDAKSKRVVYHLTGQRKVNRETLPNIIIWVADLKIDFAQRLAHRLTTQLSRIGLDEFEWQRRFAKNLDEDN